MSLSLLFSLLPFVTVMSVTPGPNNLMVAASGVNFGFRRTIPHMLGVATGFPVLLIAIGFGLGAIVAAHPALRLALKYGGCGYLFFTALKLAALSEASKLAVPPRPLSLIEAALFQWINPKAWVMAISMMGIYAKPGGGQAMQIFTLAGLLGAMGGLAVMMWTAFGAMIAERLRDTRARRTFNVTMAVLLIASLVPMLR